jgi:steroid delta-isomerase-like uncharacterized protein
MHAEETKSLARRTMEELDRRNLDGVVAQYTPDCKFHGFAPETLDVSGYKQMMSGLLAAFPDSRFPVDEMVAEGDRVAVRHRMRGTHRGEFQGIPPTGKPVEISAIAVFRTSGDKVQEIWLNADFLGMLQQLGVIPAPGQAT